MSIYKWDKVNPVSDKKGEKEEKEDLSTGDKKLDEMLRILEAGQWSPSFPDRQLRGGWHGGQFEQPLPRLGRNRKKSYAKETGEADLEWDDDDHRGLRLARTKK